MKKSLTLLTLMFAGTIVFAQETKEAPWKKVPPKKPTQEQSADTQASEDPTQLLIGTWLFVSAKAEDKDVSSDYVVGNLDGKPRMMTLKEDGTLLYDPEVMEKGYKEIKWKVVQNEKTGAYGLVMSTTMEDGTISTSREKIRVITDEKLSFGRVVVDYVRVKE